MENETEEQLVEQAVLGDRKALGALIAMHDRKLGAYIEAKLPAQVRAAVSTEDILQDCYMSAYVSITKFQAQGPGSFWAWLKTIAYRKMIDAGRKRSRQHLVDNSGVKRRVDPGESEVGGPISALADSYQGPSKDAMDQELRSAFRVAIAGLSERYREVVVMHYLQGLSRKQVAENLGLTEGAVRGLLFRARREIEEEIQRLSRFV